MRNKRSSSGMRTTVEVRGGTPVIPPVILPFHPDCLRYLRNLRMLPVAQVVLAAILLAGVLIGLSAAAEEAAQAPRLSGEPFVYTEWQTFYVKDGLPNDHIFAIRADGDRLWVGTEGGLALYEEGRWKRWTEEDGLPWKVVTGIAVSAKTGDVWLALFGGGLARFSGGRFDHFHQLNSGLANDVVYGVAVQDDTVWAATTAGVNSYNTVTGEWEIYTEKNAPLEEIWCYNVTAADDKVFVAVWGGGVLEWDVKTRRWQAYHDPDRQMEIDLFRDDGLIHIITTAVSYIDRVLWASTYFGLSRYDGRHWRGYMDHDSGLSSNFINFVVGRSADSSYSATDRGLSALVDYATDTWVTYRRETDEAQTWTANIGVGKDVVRTLPTNLTLPNHFVICLEFQGNDVWIGTGHGLARGVGRGYYSGLRQAGD
ncbi:ligand-binding sensor domain-containing protein [Syntrophobacter fumaroxidans]|uniref:Two component regulator propeller n=1 Tax=Syntrophobacter fumaroxidans (strain DSM 10017 / MPOB) TaxID=335543 RepID=A0LIQ6_SYNFM|nr:two-component regulator propeller domain-containing protein [Syntrophobacter fumaroxidans]ABK17308.1 Two component regulator propeller [Syntrophobacter fumaroxidans MPOB]